MSDKTTKNEETIEAFGGVLPDGRTVDYIKDVTTGRLRLICFDGNRYDIQDQVASNGRTFAPPDLDPAIQTAVTMPTQVSDYGSTATLFGEIRECLTTSGMSPEVATKVTYFVFQDWFREFSLPAACLIITGPRPESALLLQLLGCLSRRSLRMVEIDPRTSCGLIQYINPTVLVDATYSTPRSLRKLLASSGFPAFATYGRSLSGLCFAKAVYVGDTLPEEISTEFAIHVRLAPSQGVPFPDGRQLNQIAAAMQPKLLAYRLRNLAKVRASDFDCPEMDLEARTVARGIGRCLVDAPDLQHGLRSLIEDRNEEDRNSRWTDPTCVILEVLLDKTHAPQPDGIFVGKVAEAATALLRSRGALMQLADRAVGAVLRDLGFTPKRHAKGIRILVTTKVVRMVHDLARDYRVAAVEDGIAQCAMCHESFGVAAPAESSTEIHTEPSL